MKKIVSRGACLLLASCLSLNAVGCQKSNENNKIKEGQSISSEEAGMSINANGKNETFKPSDYTLEAKKEYVYEYLGLKFKLSDKFRNYIADKKIAMLDDQSPIDKELKYAILTFEKMTEEQKNAVIEKMGDGYKNWQNELERIGTIGIFEKNTSEEKISKIKPKNKKGLTYAQTLEARAQRGSMTHQKQFAVKQAKQKEMRGEEIGNITRKL